MLALGGLALIGLSVGVCLIGAAMRAAEEDMGPIPWWGKWALPMGLAGLAGGVLMFAEYWK